MSCSRIVLMINDLSGTFQEIIVNCSQKQFVANGLSFMQFFAWPVFSVPFDFCLQKRDKEVAPSFH